MHKLLKLILIFSLCFTKSRGPNYTSAGTPKPAPYGFTPQQQTPFPGPQQVPQMGNVFGQPIVQDMALQYGQQVVELCNIVYF